MIHGILLLLAASAAGFGVGRIKNKAKLAAAQAKLASYEASVKAVATKVETSVASKL
jgi:hypothetical protein